MPSTGHCLASGALITMLMLTTTPGWSQNSDPVTTPTALVENSTLTPHWTYSLQPYFFLAGLSGSVTVDPITIPVNSSFSYLLDNVKLGAFISLTAEKGRWGYYADFQYINLYGESSGQGNSSMDLKNIIGEVDLLFRPSSAPTLRFLVGMRAYSIRQNVTLLGIDLPEAGATVVDPILGAFGSWKLHNRWKFDLRGDIGGFGVSSETTYQLLALFRWGISDGISLPFGYRVLGYQIAKDDIRMNTRMSGMVLGLDFRF